VLIKVFRENIRHVMPWEIDQDDVRWPLGHIIEKKLEVSTRRG